MAAKPFASSADLGVKEQTLEVLADGVYALTAEGDPNVGAIEGEDFLVCFEALATPVAARRLAGQAARAHRQAGPLPGAQRTTTPCACSGASAFDAEVIVSSRADPHADRRARPAGLGERVRPDAAAVRGARLHPRPDLADADLPRPAHHRPRRRPRRAGAASSAAAGTPRATSSPGCPSRRSSSPATWSRPQAALYTGDAFHRDWAAGTLDRVKALGAEAAGRRPRRGRRAAATTVDAAIEQTRDFLLVMQRDGRRRARARRHASRRRSTPPTPRWPRQFGALADLRALPAVRRLAAVGRARRHRAAA